MPNRSISLELAIHVFLNHNAVKLRRCESIRLPHHPLLFLIDTPEIIQTDSKDAPCSHIANLRPNPACTQLRKYTCKTCIYINDFNELKITRTSVTTCTTCQVHLCSRRSAKIQHSFIETLTYKTSKNHSKPRIILEQNLTFATKTNQL